MIFFILFCLVAYLKQPTVVGTILHNVSAQQALMDIDSSVVDLLLLGLAD